MRCNAVSNGTLQQAKVTLSPIDPERLVRAHQAGVWRYLRAIGAPADVAEDLTQETFVLALDKLREDRGHAAAASFLRATARNLYLRVVRDRGRREALLVELADRDWQVDCGDDGGDAWLDALRACVERLDGRSARVVQLFYRDGRSRADVAAALDMKETGLKTLLQRLRAGLRRCIEQRRDDERGGER